MVKLARGGMNNSNRGRSKPRPLFPPGELPLFGPPPAYMRRPGPPIPPPARGPIGYDYGPPPPPPMRLPPHLGPPMPPPPHMPLRGRPGRPPPPMPLLQAPVMPPRPLPFLRGRGMGPRMGPGKGIKKTKNRRKLRRRTEAPTTSQNKPEGEYYCEVCDRSWMTPEELEVHLSEHITCHFEGCSFRAAPKLVTLHVKLQHDSGMFDKIVKSSNKEDIEKWREERRRNFPTKANIEKKLAERKEMEDRGERVEQNRKSFKKNRPNHNNGKGKSEERNFNNKRKRSKFKNSKNKSVNEVKGLNPLFLSTASLPNDDIGDAKTGQDDNISDEEWISDSKGIAESAPISNVLLNLSSAYASDSESDSHDIVSDDKISDQVKPVDKSGESDDEPPKEEKIVRQSELVLNDEINSEPSKLVDRFSKKKKLHAKRQLQPKPKIMKWEPSLRKRPLTLLEKLLTKEIKQERNFILQCIRFIINENFFDAGLN